jgi:Tfp pilus assembly protein PilF
MPIFRPPMPGAARRAGWPALRRMLLAAVPLLLAACASVDAPPPPAPEPALFDDARFAPPKEAIDPADVFRMTPQMQAYLEEVVAPMAKSAGMRKAITKALYDRRQLKLEYDSSTTRTAGEAFDARQGNCLSLMVMTGAFAKALDLQVTYRQVLVDDMWTRSGGMYFFSGHVNLMLEHHYRDPAGHFDRNDTYTIDFMPGDNASHTHVISERTVLAMFMNNRAAEALVRGQVDDAYWRLRQAIQLDPGFLSAYNTLAVVYLRRGDPSHAQQVLAHALQAEPDNPCLLANSAQALGDLGRTAEAEAVRRHLAAVEPTPPFYWFVQGQTALHQGDFQKARAMFLKEIDREPDYHEFHYALAVADFELDRLDEARQEMALAMDNAVKRTDHDLYAAKLDKLKAWQASRPRVLVQ